MPEKRRFHRSVINGLVDVGDHLFGLANLAPCGGALNGADVWWEDDMPARLYIRCGNDLFVLWRSLRSCYVDPGRKIIGFEFIGATVENIDIVLGLLLASHSHVARPLVMSPVNARALDELHRNQKADCPEGGWSAHTVDGDFSRRELVLPTGAKWVPELRPVY